MVDEKVAAFWSWDGAAYARQTDRQAEISAELISLLKWTRALLIYWKHCINNKTFLLKATFKVHYLTDLILFSFCCEIKENDEGL